MSSRRRHTISLCDWSSDVCSSDLVTLVVPLPTERVKVPELLNVPGTPLGAMLLLKLLAQPASKVLRSEERRVGKAWRSRGWSSQSQENVAGAAMFSDVASARDS